MAVTAGTAVTVAIQPHYNISYEYGITYECSLWIIDSKNSL